jgi:hypothetical protein
VLYLEGTVLAKTTAILKRAYGICLSIAYANPNPSLPRLIDRRSLSFSSSFEVYAGRSNWFKHVCAEGKGLLAGFSCSPTLAILKGRLANPPTGGIGVPEENFRRRLSSLFVTEFLHHLPEPNNLLVFSGIANVLRVGS